MQDIDKLFNRIDHLLDRLDEIIPKAKANSIQLGEFRAYRWQQGNLQGIETFDSVRSSDLLNLDRQSSLLATNTALFVADKPANNALLWGARGTGKSSLIKAQLNNHLQDNLCVVEIPKDETSSLFEIIKQLSGLNRKFILYLDDLSFEANDDSYKSLKAALEGSLQAQPDNVIIYATSNRRHLIPEFMQENLDSSMIDGQLHPSDSIEEKVSLSDRFGLWLSFHPFTQDEYLDVVELALNKFKLKMDGSARTESLRFATARGSRSGRIAVQFATYWLGIR